MEIIKDCLTDTFIDTLKLLPILFLTYLLMEYLEHKAGDRTVAAIRSARKCGPLAGGLLGVVPQCGIAGGAASLYATRVITAGTFIAVMLATSDEMLPLMIAAGNVADLLQFILFKVIYGIAAGFALDGLISLIDKRQKEKKNVGENVHHIHHHGCEHDHDHDNAEGHDDCNGDGICSVCVRDGCHCEHGVFRSALHHTVQVTLMIFAVSLVISCAVAFIGEERISALPVNTTVAGEIIAGLIGLIPNCSVSVMLTGFYTDGVIGAGPLMAGLLVNGGVGLLVLFRTNRGKKYLKQNLSVVSVLYLAGVVGGIIAELIFR